MEQLSFIKPTIKPFIVDSFSANGFAPDNERKKLEKTEKSQRNFGKYLTIFCTHAIISNCADYVPRNFLCISGGVPRADRACDPE